MIQLRLMCITDRCQFNKFGTCSNKDVYVEFKNVKPDAKCYIKRKEKHARRNKDT